MSTISFRGLLFPRFRPPGFSNYFSTSTFRFPTVERANSPSIDAYLWVSPPFPHSPYVPPHLRSQKSDEEHPRFNIMSSTSTRGKLQYLRDSLIWNDVKPYEIKGKVQPGQARNNVDLEGKVVAIEDARVLTDAPSLEKHGFQWFHCPTDESFDSQEGIDRYLSHMTDFMKAQFASDFVFIQEYRVRDDHPLCFRCLTLMIASQESSGSPDSSVSPCQFLGPRW